DWKQEGGDVGCELLDEHILVPGQVWPVGVQGDAQSSSDIQAEWGWQVAGWLLLEPIGKPWFEFRRPSFLDGICQSFQRWLPAHIDAFQLCFRRP
ncbi:hypothetical protein L0F63_003161, partial [Massospora cicadina]